MLNITLKIPYTQQTSRANHLMLKEPEKARSDLETLFLFRNLHGIEIEGHIFILEKRNI